MRIGLFLSLALMFLSGCKSLNERRTIEEDSGVEIPLSVGQSCWVFGTFKDKDDEDFDTTQRRVLHSCIEAKVGNSTDERAFLESLCSHGVVRNMQCDRNIARGGCQVDFRCSDNRPGCNTHEQVRFYYDVEGWRRDEHRDDCRRIGGKYTQF